MFLCRNFTKKDKINLYIGRGDIMREQSISNNLSRFLRKIYCIDTSYDPRNGEIDDLGFELFGNSRDDLMTAFKLGFAKYYKNSTDEFKEKASLFLSENDKYNKMSIDEIGEKESEKLVDEFKKIIRSIDSTL